MNNKDKYTKCKLTKRTSYKTKQSSNTYITTSASSNTDAAILIITGDENVIFNHVLTSNAI